MKLFWFWFSNKNVFLNNWFYFEIHFWRSVSVCLTAKQLRHWFEDQNLFLVSKTQLTGMSSGSDPEFYNAFDEFAVCKYCYTSRGLIDRQVCDCREIMSCICFECLRQTILKRSPEAPTDARGWPVCPDCRGSYKGVEFILAQNNWTFLEYLRMTRGWTKRDLIIMFGWPAVVTAGINLLNYFVPESDPYTQMYRNTTSATVSAAVATYGYFGQSLRLYFIEYEEYLERPQTEIIDIEMEPRGRLSSI